ncbi:MAG TPA: DUF378 domain-containing protein [Acidobacteriaceae bacterium]|jgi:hypothetical protein|nr:DUF378 domain-containing protein [Acidobacteriaceae bacterium]
MKAIDILAIVLLVVGGLNWGLFGSMHFDLVAKLFGDYSALSRVVYGLVGLAAVYEAVAWNQMQKRWRGTPAPVR